MAMRCSAKLRVSFAAAATTWPTRCASSSTVTVASSASSTRCAPSLPRVAAGICSSRPWRSRAVKVLAARLDGADSKALRKRRRSAARPARHGRRRARRGRGRQGAPRRGRHEGSDPEAQGRCADRPRGRARWLGAAAAGRTSPRPAATRRKGSIRRSPRSPTPYRRRSADSNGLGSRAIFRLGPNPPTPGAQNELD